YSRNAPGWSSTLRQAAHRVAGRTPRFAMYDRRTGYHRFQLRIVNLAVEVLHSAVGRHHQLLCRYESQRRASAFSNELWCLHLGITEIQTAEHDAFASPCEWFES